MFVVWGERVRRGSGAQGELGVRGPWACLHGVGDCAWGARRVCVVWDRIRGDLRDRTLLGGVCPGHGEKVLWA